MTTAHVTLTIGQAAELLPVPGKTRAARAQKLRRLERSGAVPTPARNVFGDREYTFPSPSAAGSIEGELVTKTAVEGETVLQEAPGGTQREEVES